MKLTDTPCEITRHPPLLGEHTAEVLQEKLAYSSEKIEELRKENIV